MKGQVQNDYGSVSISTEVISMIAGSAALGCFGVIGMARVSLADGFARLLKKDSLTKGIKVIRDEDGGIALRMHIIVSYGVNIYTVAHNLIDTVRYQVEEHTGLGLTGIEVCVEGVRRID